MVSAEVVPDGASYITSISEMVSLCLLKEDPFFHSRPVPDFLLIGIVPRETTMKDKFDVYETANQ